LGEIGSKLVVQGWVVGREKEIIISGVFVAPRDLGKKVNIGIGKARLKLVGSVHEGEAAIVALLDKQC